MLKAVTLSLGLATGILAGNAQQTPVKPNTYVASTVATAGVVGTTLQFPEHSTTPGATYTVRWSDVGSAPTVCTARVEGSADNVNWEPITSPVSCLTSGSVSTQNPFLYYLRVNVLTYTAADATTAVTFNVTNP